MRLSYSPYQARNFPEMERAVFEKWGLGYVESPEHLPPGRLILISNSQTALGNIPPQVWERTLLLVHPNSGYDNIPAGLLERYSFPIVVGNPIRAHAVANYVLGQIYQHFNPPPYCTQWDSLRHWFRRPLKNGKVLLLGRGHVGNLVFKALAPLVKEIYCHDPFKGYHLDDLIEKAAECDIILPLCSLNPTSRAIVNAQLLAALPSRFVLINGARGKLVEQKALIEALNRRPDAFAYLDVFEREPFYQQDFSQLKNSNLKTTSHVAGVYCGLDDDILHFTTSICRDYLESEKSFMAKHRDILLQNRRFEGMII